MNIVFSGTSSRRAYLWMLPMWWMAPPTASSSAVKPRVKYSFSVMGGTSSSGRRSWMTTLSLSKSTVETSASPASFFCLAIMELNPPIVSVSSPDMEPLRSRIKTNSVVCFIKKPPVICYLYGSKSQESSGRFSSDIFMRRASSDQRRTELR